MIWTTENTNDVHPEQKYKDAGIYASKILESWKILSILLFIYNGDPMFNGLIQDHLKQKQPLGIQISKFGGLEGN